MSELVLEKKDRSFIPADLKIKKWADIEPYFTELNERKITSLKEFEKWLSDVNELVAILSEEQAWRYIHLSRNTADKSLEETYLDFVKNIAPHVSEAGFDINKKYYASSLREELDKSRYKIYDQSVANEIELFRKENVAIKAEIAAESKKFSAISGSLSVTIDGEELTLQQASKYLFDLNREKRKEAFEKSCEARYQKNEEFDELFNILVKKRHQIATNAGFDNYRDYMFRALGRFDYSVSDVEVFHNSIRDQILPVVEESNRVRKGKLGLDVLRPYDLNVDEDGKEALKPVENGEELIDKTIECFRRIKPELGNYLQIMKDNEYLDLESRMGKAPGGYNYPLQETGIPFIFMNASGVFRDLVTMVHEGGHAIHSFVTRDLPYVIDKSTPSEVAELASMSMELISMEHWDVFFEDEEELRRAKYKQLSGVLDILPWIATISKFQHWIYVNPEHSVAERDEAWLRIYNEFSDKTVDWTGYEKYRTKWWQRQSHIFDVPFYYIEYAIAQLGSIAVYRNYKKNREEGLNNYLEALKLGYTKSVPEIYERAGIKFDFGSEYISELASFIQEESNKYKA